MPEPTYNKAVIFLGAATLIVAVGGILLAAIDKTVPDALWTALEAGIGACWTSPWAYKDKIYFLDENGSIRFFNAGEPLGQLTENKLEGKFWASPAFTSDAYIIKGSKQIFCLEK